MYYHWKHSLASHFTPQAECQYHRSNYVDLDFISYFYQNVVAGLAVIVWDDGRLTFDKKVIDDLMVYLFNTLRPRQNGRRFAGDVFKYIFLNENVWISLKISLKFVPKVPINNIPALVQILAWRRSGDKPLSEPMVVSLLTRHSASMS